MPSCGKMLVRWMDHKVSTYVADGVLVRYDGGSSVDRVSVRSSLNNYERMANKVSKERRLGNGHGQGQVWQDAGGGS